MTGKREAAWFFSFVVVSSSSSSGVEGSGRALFCRRHPSVKKVARASVSLSELVVAENRFNDEKLSGLDLRLWASNSVWVRRFGRRSWAARCCGCLLATATGLFFIGAFGIVVLTSFSDWLV